MQKLLVEEITSSGFETLRGDKTHCFISKQQAYKKQTKTLNIRPLFFSLVFLSCLSHTQ
jgi:hypothetical protein